MNDFEHLLPVKFMPGHNLRLMNPDDMNLPLAVAAKSLPMETLFTIREIQRLRTHESIELARIQANRDISATGIKADRDIKIARISHDTECVRARTQITLAKIQEDTARIEKRSEVFCSDNETAREWIRVGMPNGNHIKIVHRDHSGCNKAYSTEVTVEYR